MKGLIISVYRDARLGDCTNNGISSQFDELTLVGEGIPEIFDVTEDRPAVKVVKRDLWSDRKRAREIYLHLEPVDERFNAGRWLMAGGNWAYTCDSRFPANHPLSIHDRFEG